MFVDPLIQKGYEVLAFDAPAHGRSSGKQINALIYSDFIKDIIIRYGPVHSFIAHSFGGLALCLAMETIPHDERSRLVLIAPATESVTAADQLFKFIGLKSKAVQEEFDKIIFGISGNALSWFSVARALATIKAKTLWIHDENDTVTPLSDVLKIDRSLYPSVHFMITKGLGHSRIYRDNEVGRTIAKFL
jgi:pimeloyl-ACP methyl ester carboxylesterase